MDITISAGTRFAFSVDAKVNPQSGIAVAFNDANELGWFTAVDEDGQEWLLNTANVVEVLPAVEVADADTDDDLVGLSGVQVEDELGFRPVVGAVHFSPWGTSESFICGANAVGRRNSGRDLDRSQTTCRECLAQLERMGI